jgi:hypothetical protein
MQVLDEIEAALKKAHADFQKLMATDVPAFNKAMAGKVAPITDTQGK